MPVPTSHWDGLLAVDLFAPDGTPVLACVDGFAYVQGWLDKGGWTVWLEGDNGLDFYYAHLRAERIGGRVKAGDVIGYVSNTGNAATTPPHLHLAIMTRGTEPIGGGGNVAPWEWLAEVP